MLRESDRVEEDREHGQAYLTVGIHCQYFNKKFPAFDEVVLNHYIHKVCGWKYILHVIPSKLIGRNRLLDHLSGFLESAGTSHKMGHIRSGWTPLSQAGGCECSLAPGNFLRSIFKQLDLGIDGACSSPGRKRNFFTGFSSNSGVGSHGSNAVATLQNVGMRVKFTSGDSKGIRPD